MIVFDDGYGVRSQKDILRRFAVRICVANDEASGDAADEE